ncbi:MAG: hypothetical protein AUJ58_01465 [Zetaproteobacteria bacterium CG1_02_55_237]|nr:MAG: hypothetical protein AUJ58_01465 [Zetaproteobacteria bacterium CG1_02_55_237]
MALLWQLGAGLFGMLAAVLCYDTKVALGLGFGVVIVMLSTMLLGRRIHDAAAADVESGQRMLYAGAVMRFVFVLAALVMAYSLGLHLLAVAVGMVLSQAAMFFFAASGLRAQFKRPG